MRLQATHGPTYQHYHENFTFHRSGTFVRTRANTPPALWVGPFTSWKQSATVSMSKAATPWASVMREPSHSEWWQLKSPTKQKKDLGSTDWMLPIASQRQSNTLVIRTSATIDYKQITIQPLTRNLSNHELTTTNGY